MPEAPGRGNVPRGRQSGQGIYGRLRRLALPAVLGAVAALGQAPFGLWPLTVMALAALYGLWRADRSVRAAALSGWAAGTGYFLVSLRWIVEPFFVDAARHGWMAPFALLLVGVGFGLFWMAALGGARALGGTVAAWIASLVLAEAVRGVLFTGFPWAQIGHVWIDTGVRHWAAIAGPLGLCAVTAAASAALWHLAAGRRLWGGMALLGLAAFYLGGPMIAPVPATGPDAPVVRLIQPNAPQHEKWDPAKVRMFFDRQVAYTGAADVPDLVVWPETAVPVMLNDAEAALAHIARAARGAPVVLGMQRHDGPRSYNSLVLLDGAGQVAEVYDKHHLVPFGEYLPMGDLLSRFGLRGLAQAEGGGYSPGPGPQVIGTGGTGRALPLICYEGVFPRNIAGAPERPDFLLMITNDAWFGDMSGPYQHLAQARLRSAEQGLPMIRVANTGVSAMIDSAGRITGSLPLGQAGWLDLPLPDAAPATLYARSGDWPVLSLALLAVIVLTGRTVRHRARSR